MANRRKSNLAKAIRGTARHDRVPKKDHAARLSRAPTPPAGLSEAAAAEWRRLAPSAVSIGTLTLADLRAFELLCETLAAEREARSTLQREGMSTSTGDGGRKPHPAVRVAESARRDAARLLADFGLTPRGRQSVDTLPPTDLHENGYFFDGPPVQTAAAARRGRSRK